MDIDGPLKVGVVEPSPEGNYELHLTFTDEFKALDLQAQAAEMQVYLGRLSGDIAALAEDDPNRQGMLLVQQICEQLAAPVSSGDLALGETLVVEIQRTPGVNLMDLLG